MKYEKFLNQQYYGIENKMCENVAKILLKIPLY